MPAFQARVPATSGDGRFFGAGVGRGVFFEGLGDGLWVGGVVTIRLGVGVTRRVGVGDALDGDGEGVWVGVGVGVGVAEGEVEGEGVAVTFPAGTWTRARVRVPVVAELPGSCGALGYATSNPVSAARAVNPVW
jgi:hypothetical protein